MVHRFFAKKDKGFGSTQLAWATVAYAGVLLLFWIIHLRLIGCPNCINTACPLNPENHG
jgi:hypothetical protein